MSTRYRSACSFLLAVVFAGMISCGESDNTGAIATLSWDPAPDESNVSYTVHYGKQSSVGAGSCNYENQVDVSEPSARITGLEFNTRYYFAVSAYNGQRSSCSGEVSKLTDRLSIGS
jgi:hypothetical protein